MTAGVVIIGVLALIAYASNRFSLQSVSLTLIAALGSLYALQPIGSETPRPSSVFAGFASEALVAIVALMVLGRALILTGALQPLATALSRALGVAPRFAFAAVLIGGFALSGFLNDTPVVVMLLPIIIGAAARIGASPGTMLIPMNYAVILGGMMTAIGTSTNLLVVGLSQANGGPAFEFFDFYLIALPPAALGLLYLLTVAPWMLRNTGAAPGNDDDEVFLSSLRIGADSKLIGGKLHDLTGKLGHQVRLRHVMRNGRQLAKLPTLHFLRGDMLIVAGNAAGLAETADQIGLHPEDAPSSTADANDSDAKTISLQCVVSAGSPLAGLTVRESNLESRFELRVVGLSEAISHEHTRLASDVKFVPVCAGDSLLLEGPEDNIGLACERLALIPVGEPLRRHTSTDAIFALVIFGLVIAAAVFKILPIAIAAVIGVMACVVTRVLTWEDIEASVQWRIVLIVASSIALGNALVQSGAMSLVAEQLLRVAGNWPMAAVIGLILCATGIVTNFVSNNAAAAIMTPLALEIGRLLEAPLEPFVLAVLFGANLCFLTPMAYQTNLLVMSAGGYRFNDFPRVGLPLFVIMVPALTASLAWHYL